MLPLGLPVELPVVLPDRLPVEAPANSFPLPELGLETRLSALHLLLTIGCWNKGVLTRASGFRATLPALLRTERLVGAQTRSKASRRAAREGRDAHEGATETWDGLGARLGCVEGAGGFATVTMRAVGFGGSTVLTRHDRGSEDTRRFNAGSGGKSKSKKVLRTMSAMRICVNKLSGKPFFGWPF